MVWCFDELTVSELKYGGSSAEIFQNERMDK